MKLNKPIKIDLLTKSHLEHLKYKMLLFTNGCYLAVMSSFEIEEKVRFKTVRPWFKKSFVKREVNYYITDIEIWGYDPKGKYWGTFLETKVQWLFYYHNLNKLRNNYLDFIKTPLEKLGFSLDKKAN